MTDQLPPYTPSREMPSYNPATAVPPRIPSHDYRSRPSGYSGGPASKKMATWALVLGIIPIGLANIIALVLGVRVLLRGSDGRNHGQVRAVVGMVLASLWLLLTVVVLTGNLPGLADRDPAGVITQRGHVPSTELNIGDCLPAEVAANTETLIVELAPCTEPHKGEVYAEFALAAGPYPGDAHVTRLAEGGCVMRFQTFIGTNYDKSELELTFLQPIRDSWSQNREVTCMAGGTEPTTGSLKGVKR